MRFKVGDRVTARQNDFLHGYASGDILTITAVDGDFIVFVDNDGNSRLRPDDEFELLPVADATGKPAFRVGDRVRVLSDYLPWASADEIGTVEDVNTRDRDCFVKFETERMGDHTWYVRWDNLELAPSITIETGKFYRTRDGRKVGPMEIWNPAVEHPWQQQGGSAVFSAGGDIWRDDGSSKYDVAQLTAEWFEWVDEPASNDNAPLTKTAIVALIEGGEPKPSEQPKVHKSEQVATDEAERLAVKYPGQKFGVFVLADSRIADVVIRRAA